jgi:hypothetical protein
MQQLQPAQSSPGRVGQTRSGIPMQVTWAVRCLLAFVLLNLVVVGLLVAHRGDIAETIRQSNPSWSQDQLDAFVASIVVGGSVVHVIFVALTLWLAFMVQNGRRWARVVLTIVLVLNLAIGLSVFVSPIAGTIQQLINLISALLKLASIGLLWLPGPSRAYFAKPKQPVA